MATDAPAPAPPLPPEVMNLWQVTLTARARWEKALRQLRRSMSKARDAGAGDVSFPSPVDPATQAAQLGLAWPRRGRDRCQRCDVCQRMPTYAIQHFLHRINRLKCGGHLAVR